MRYVQVFQKHSSDFRILGVRRVTAASSILSTNTN